MTPAANTSPDDTAAPFLDPGVELHPFRTRSSLRKSSRIGESDSVRWILWRYGRGPTVVALPRSPARPRA